MTVNVDRSTKTRSYREHRRKMVETGEFFEIDDDSTGTSEWTLPLSVRAKQSDEGS